MARRSLILSACLIAGFCAVSFLSVPDSSAGILDLIRSAQIRLARSRDVGDLKEQLKSKLRPRSPQEFAFLERVVRMVEDDELSLRLVRVTFNWARKKRTRYRFPYFQRALTIEAAKRGIRID